MTSKTEIKRINIQSGRAMEHGLIGHKREFLTNKIMGWVESNS